MTVQQTAPARGRRRGHDRGRARRAPRPRGATRARLPLLVPAWLGVAFIVLPLLALFLRADWANITTHLAEREPYYQKAHHVLNVDVLDNYDKIKDSVAQLRQMLDL